MLDELKVLKDQYDKMMKTWGQKLKLERAVERKVQTFSEILKDLTENIYRIFAPQYPQYDLRITPILGAGVITGFQVDMFLDDVLVDNIKVEMTPTRDSPKKIKVY